MITFSELDSVSAIITYSDVVVIIMILVNKEVWRVYMDTLVAFNIIYKRCLEKLGINRTYLRPISSLHTFAENEVTPEGIITFLATIGNFPK